MIIIEFDQYKEEGIESETVIKVDKDVHADDLMQMFYNVWRQLTFSESQWEKAIDSLY